MRRFLSWALVVALLAIAGTLASPAGAQAIIRIYGTLSGAPIAITASSLGYMNVNVAGGTFAIPVSAPASGACVTPSFTFTGDTDTGMGYLGANNAAGCANGATIFDWNASRVLFAQPVQTASVKSAGGTTIIFDIGGFQRGGINNNYGFVTALNYGYTFNANGSDIVSADTGLWRESAGVVSVGTSTGPGAATGTLKSGIVTKGSVPAVSNTTANSCGTTAATIAGNDNNGVITVGATAGTNCTIAFTVAAATRRECTSSNETTGNLSRTTYIDTTHSTVEGTFVAGDLISYVCFAR